MFLAFFEITTLPYLQHSPYLLKHLPRYFLYALANVDSRVTHLQIEAIFNIGEGERRYTEGKVS